jgi:hypothetical protein
MTLPCPKCNATGRGSACAYPESCYYGQASNLYRIVATVERLKAEYRNQSEFDKHCSSAWHENCLAAQKERDEYKDRIRTAENFLYRQGYRSCDVAACNCNQWHMSASGLVKQRDEYKAALELACSPRFPTDARKYLNSEYWLEQARKAEHKEGE